MKDEVFDQMLQKEGVKTSMEQDPPEGGEVVDTESQGREEVDAATTPEPQDNNVRDSQESSAGEPEKEFSVSTYLKDKFGIEIEQEEDIKGFYERAQKASKLEEELKMRDDMLENVKSPFADESVRKMNALYNKYPDMDRRYLTKLISTDFDEMSDKDVLMMKYEKDDPDIRKKVTPETYINYKFGIQEDVDEDDEDAKKLQGIKQYELESAARQARAELKGLKEVEVEDGYSSVEQFKKSREDEYSGLKDKWAAPTKVLASDLKEFAVYDKESKEPIASMDIDEGFVQRMQQELPEIAADSGLDPSDPQDAKRLMALAQTKYLIENQDKLVKKIIADTEARIHQEYYDKNNVDKRRQEYNANPTGDEGSVEEQVMNQMFKK